MVSAIIFKNIYKVYKIRKDYILKCNYCFSSGSIGSMRSADSIKTKIARIMASYKEANERLNATGSGLEGIEYTNFQEYVVNNICKYYYQLDPVLKNRPNVCCWHTNDKMRGKNVVEEINQSTHDRDIQTILLSSDEEDTSVSDVPTHNPSDKESNNEYDEDRPDDINVHTTNTNLSSFQLYNEELETNRHV